MDNIKEKVNELSQVIRELKTRQEALDSACESLTADIDIEDELIDAIQMIVQNAQYSINGLDELRYEIKDIKSIYSDICSKLNELSVAIDSMVISEEKDRIRYLEDHIKLLEEEKKVITAERDELQRIVLAFRNNVVRQAEAVSLADKYLSEKGLL